MVNRFLAPLTQNEFEARYWEQSPVFVILPPENGMRGINTTAEELRASVGQASDTWGKIQLAHHDSAPPGWLDLSREPPGPFLLDRALGQGDTIILNDVQENNSQIAEVCSELERAFHFPVNANCYLTPQHSQGLDIHFDMESVFVVQLSGSKHWRVFSPSIEWPEESAPVIADELGEPIIRATLRAGDLLYIPRGFPHDAHTEREDSCHITFALSPVTWKSLLSHLVNDAAASGPELRRALPPRFLSQPSDLSARLDSLMRETAIWPPSRDVIDTFFTKYFTLFTRTKEWNRDAGPVQIVTPDSVLRRRNGHLCHVFTKADLVHFVSSAGELTGPAFLAEEFQLIATRDQIRVLDISAKLSLESKLCLAQRFVAEGILMPL